MLYDLEKPAATMMESVLSPLSTTVWTTLAATVVTTSLICLVTIKASSGVGGTVRIILSVSSALLLQDLPVPKRLLPHIAFWTLASAFISNYYLAYLSSSVTVPEVIKEYNIDQVLQTGRKFYAYPEIQADMQSWVRVMERSDKQPRSLDADSKLLNAVMSASSGPARFKNIQDALLQQYAVVFPLRMAKPLMSGLPKIFGQNAHVLKQDFMRSAQWYGIDGPYEDILAAGFRRLVEAGIERFWVDLDGKTYGDTILARYLGDEVEQQKLKALGDHPSLANLSSLLTPRKIVIEDGAFVAASISDSLISECFTAYAVGISFALVSFIAPTAWFVVQSTIACDFVTVE